MSDQSWTKRSSRIVDLIELSPDQMKARDKIMDWWRAPVQPFRLGGLAGTGKSTITTWIAGRLPKVNIAFVAYTGKASHVLREHLTMMEIDYYFCGTIHQLIYDTYERKVWNDSHTRMITVVVSKRRDQLPPGIDLIVVDEASMVNKQIWDDLVSYNVPILAVGDFFQLPPIANDGYSVVGEDLLDVKLERIHRQAEHSPIIQVARHARETGVIPFGYWSQKVRKLHTEDAHRISVAPDTLVLTGRNRTRVFYNDTIRKIRGIYQKGPVVGDRVVCRRNNHAARIANGMCGEIIDIEPYEPDDASVRMSVRLDHGEEYTGRALMRYFGSERYQKRSSDPNDPGDTWDYGYSLTVHCSQGSQAHSVIVVEERLPRTTEVEFARWLYTAVTRATDDLLVLG